MNKFWGHLKTILTHKRWVFYYACKAGIPFRGLMHDLSKFTPIEFIESIHYFKGDGVSPINHCKKSQGYSLSWQHHKGHNPHHYEYWIDHLDEGGTPIKMPFKYVVELICDYLAAGKTYNGKKFTYEDERQWFLKKVLSDIPPKMHIETKIFIQTIFSALAAGSKFNKKLFISVKQDLNY